MKFGVFSFKGSSVQLIDLEACNPAVAQSGRSENSEAVCWGRYIIEEQPYQVNLLKPMNGTLYSASLGAEVPSRKTLVTWQEEFF